MQRALVLLILQSSLFAQTNYLLQKAALSQVGVTTHYSGRYVRIPYPNGDVDTKSGACTDVLIRAFRMHGIDLQKLVHEDMVAHFSSYPQRWGLRAPDRNIDHRLVPNLMTFFRHSGKELPITRNPEDYRSGDIVAWDLGRGVTHIGFVSDEKAPGSRRKIIHNIGRGVKVEDILFVYQIIGHYRYFKD
jgi:uncharacterized protein YijF (DUF1287 family)